MDKSKKHELKDIQLYEENGQYYLRLKYIIEDDHKIEELEIPKVVIPVNSHALPHLNYECNYSGAEHCELCAGGGCDSIRVFKGDTSEANHVYYTTKTIKEKSIELTLSEIEKKLGYKIKIISEESKNV